MQSGDKITINRQVYEAYCFDIEKNSLKTNCSSPCIMCDFDALKDMEICKTVDCINGTDFLYLKKYSTQLTLFD